MTDYTQCPTWMIEHLIQSTKMTDLKSHDQKIIALFRHDALKRSERKKRKLFFNLLPKEIRNIILIHLGIRDICMMIDLKLFPNDPMTLELKEWAYANMSSYNPAFLEYLIRKEGDKSWMCDLTTKWVNKFDFKHAFKLMYPGDSPQINCFIGALDHPEDICGFCRQPYQHLFSFGNAAILMLISYLISKKSGCVNPLLKYGAENHPEKFLSLLQLGVPIDTPIIEKYITTHNKSMNGKEMGNIFDKILRYIPIAEQSKLIFNVLCSIISHPRPKIGPYLDIIDRYLSLDQNSKTGIRSGWIIDLMMKFCNPEEGLELLVKHHFNFNDRDIVGKSLLQEAVLSENLTLIKALIGRGADPHQKYNIYVYGVTAEKSAVDCSIFTPEILKYFLETLPGPAAIATQELFNICSSNTLYGDCSTMILSAEYCLEAGADLLAVNSKKESFIIQSVLAGSGSFLGYLLQKYKKKNLLKVLEIPDSDGSTPIIIAAEQKYSVGMAILIAYGVNVNAKNNAGQTAPLIIAKSRNTEMVLQFIAAGADLEMMDADGKKISDYLPQVGVFK